LLFHSSLPLKSDCTDPSAFRVPVGNLNAPLPYIFNCLFHFKGLYAFVLKISKSNMTTLSLKLYIPETIYNRDLGQLGIFQR